MLHNPLDRCQSFIKLTCSSLFCSITDILCEDNTLCCAWHATLQRYCTKFQGYEKFGIHRRNGETVFRDWAPAAQAAWLIGDFNGWEGTPLEKDEFGVWSVALSDNSDGTAAIPHNTRVKIRVQHWDGWTIDLVPAWTSYAVMPEGMDSTFDGVHWDPPAGERHVWYVTLL